MAQQVRSLAALAEDRVCFPAPTWQYTTVCNSIATACNSILEDLIHTSGLCSHQIPDTHMVQIHIILININKTQTKEKNPSGIRGASVVKSKAPDSIFSIAKNKNIFLGWGLGVCVTNQGM